MIHTVTHRSPQIAERALISRAHDEYTVYKVRALGGGPIIYLPGPAQASCAAPAGGVPPFGIVTRSQPLIANELRGWKRADARNARPSTILPRSLFLVKMKKAMQRTKLRRTIIQRRPKSASVTPASTKEVTEELKAGAAGSRSMIGSVSASGCRPRGCAVPFELLRVDLLQLQSVDHVAQTFGGRFFVQMRIPGGALDEDLMRDINDCDPQFPTDTLRPGAKWFFDQLDFPTALHHELTMKKVVKQNDHLDLVLRLSGTFFEHMELEDFPFDVQRLTLVLAFNCQAKGPVPVMFTQIDSAVLTINVSMFALSNLWNLHHQMAVRQHAIHPFPGATYPALQISCMVWRRWGYVFTNILFPMSVLTVLALLQFFLPGDHYSAAGGRIAYTTTILLTSATFKLFVATELPAIGYLTLCDKYVLLCFLLQAGLVAEGAVMGALVLDKSGHDGWPEWSTDAADDYLFVIFVGVFMVATIWFIIHAYRSHLHKKKLELDDFADVNRHDATADFYRSRTNVPSLESQRIKGADEVHVNHSPCKSPLGARAGAVLSNVGGAMLARRSKAYHP